MVQRSKKTCSPKNRCYLNIKKHMGAVAMTLSSLIATSRGSEWPRQLDLEVLQKVAKIHPKVNVAEANPRVVRFGGRIYKAYGPEHRRSYLNEIDPVLKQLQESCKDDDYLGAQPVVVDAHATDLKGFPYESYTSQPEITGGVELIDLAFAVQDGKINIPASAGREMMLQLIEFLEKMRVNNMVHKDLHLQNMILKDGKIQVIDMDAAKSFNTEESNSFPFAGTLITSYSPEICALLNGDWNREWRHRILTGEDGEDEEVLQVAFRNELWSIITACYTVFTGADIRFMLMTNEDFDALKKRGVDPNEMTEEREKEIFRVVSAFEGKTFGDSLTMFEEHLITNLKPRQHQFGDKYKADESQGIFVNDLCKILSAITTAGEDGAKYPIGELLAYAKEKLIKWTGAAKRAAGRKALSKVAKAYGQLY